MFPFFSPFFPIFVTSYILVFFKVRVRTISIVNARSRRRIFFRARVAIIPQRVIISGEWRSLRLAPRDRSPPSGFTQRLGLLCRDYSSCFLSCVTSDIRADERGVRAMSLRLSRSLVLPHRSCRYVTHQGGRASEGCER